MKSELIKDLELDEMTTRFIEKIQQLTPEEREEVLQFAYNLVKSPNL